VAIKIVGTTQYTRKDNRIETFTFVSFEDDVYQIMNVGFGGLMIGGYEGKLMSGMGCKVKGFSLEDNNFVDVHIDCVVARRVGNQIGIQFVELDQLSYEVLEALIMRRKKFFKK